MHSLPAGTYVQLDFVHDGWFTNQQQSGRYKIRGFEQYHDYTVYELDVQFREGWLKTIAPDIIWPSRYVRITSLGLLPSDEVGVVIAKEVPHHYKRRAADNALAVTIVGFAVNVAVSYASTAPDALAVSSLLSFPFIGVGRSGGGMVPLYAKPFEWLLSRDRIMRIPGGQHAHLMIPGLNVGIYQDAIFGKYSVPAMIAGAYVWYLWSDAGPGFEAEVGILSPIGEGFEMIRPHVMTAMTSLRDEMFEAGQAVVTVTSDFGETLVEGARTMGRMGGAALGGFVDEAPEGIAEFGTDMGEAVTGGTRTIFYTIAGVLAVTLFMKLR